MRDEHHWKLALAEHENAVRAFLAACDRIAPGDWQRAPGPGKWSAAAVALHVCRAYELGRDAAAGGPGMRLQVSPRVAWFSRTMVLPVILATKRFPRGVAAPAEVVPDGAEARLLTKEDAAARLLSVARLAAEALSQAGAERTAPFVTHAYFGSLTPHAALRLLSAHTWHHGRGLATI